MQDALTPADGRETPRWRLLRYALAVACVIAGVLIARGLHSIMDATTPLLVAVVVTTWFAGLGPGLLASVLGTLAVDYYFSEPLYTISLDLSHVPRLIAFAVLALIFASASAARRRAEQALRRAHAQMEDRVRERTAALEQTARRWQTESEERRRAEAAVRERANLLDLTHDTVFARDMHDVITFWNHGAEEQYGWPRDTAIGRVSHELLQTVFPEPLSSITAELTRTGRWEGELRHIRRNGTTLVVASRWALQADEHGHPLAILETNNDITERKQAEQALRDLAGRLISAQEEERSRIGRELHDHISQRLGILTIKIDQLRAQPSAPAKPERLDLVATLASIDEALAELRHDTNDITADVHRLSHRLHSSMLDHLGLVPALQRLVGEFSERHNIDIRFSQTALPARLPSEVALTLFRVVEEGLNNVAKHSGARAAWVHVAGGTDGLHLTIGDGGNGFDPATLPPKGGLGFVSMRERLRLVRGTVRVDSAPARGTRVDVWVPPDSLVLRAQAEPVNPIP